MTGTRHAAALGMVLILTAVPAGAADEPDELVPGASAIVRYGMIAKFIARGAFDLPDTTNQPTVEGATLSIFDTGGGMIDVYPLANLGWRGLGSPAGSSQDCPPSQALNIGTIPIGLALDSGTVNWVGVPASNPASACVPPHDSCQQRSNGAFGPNGGAVKTIQAIGAPAGAIVDGLPHEQTLASVFCIPPTNNPTVDAAADLPGPAGATLHGQRKLCAPGTCPP